MKKSERLYPYGFIFKDKFLINNGIPNHYSKINILDNYEYYYDDILTPSIYKKNNDFIMIHGHFVHIGIDESYNNKELLEKLLESYFQNYNDFLNILDFIGGRFVIFIGNNSKVNIYHDAAGTRTVYYSKEYKIVSSHAHFINDLIEHEKDLSIRKYNPLTYSFDNSPYLSIKSLLPNFNLEFHTKRVSRYFPRQANKYKAFSDEDKINIVSKLWKNQIHYYSENYDNIAFSLTGGNDSRVSLAMVKEYLSTIKFFTYTTKENDKDFNNRRSKILNLDQYIVKQILSDLHLNHQFFFLDYEKEPLTRNEIIVMNKNALKAHGRKIIPFYNELFPEQYVIHIRANLLEIGSASYLSNNSPNNIKSVEQKFKGYISKYLNVLPNELYENIFERGIEVLGYNNELFDYHLVDLYYWEDRMGRWYSEILNETDSSFDTLTPFNMRAIIEVALSFEYNDRKSDKLFSELINLNYSVLNFYGKNNLKNLYEQILEKKKLKNSKKNNEVSFSHFYSYNNEKKDSKRLTTNNNSIYIPKFFCVVGSYSEVKFIFEEDRGTLKLSLLSLYNNPKGKNYLQYEVYKNNKILLIEDMSKWNIEANINIMNMKKHDEIKITVRCLKNIKSDAMKIASTLYVTEYQEISSDKIVSNDISTTSPYSQIIH